MTPDRHVAFASRKARHVMNATMPLASRLDRLTGPAERAVAEFLVTSGPRAAAMSAQQIAEAAGTSDATVVRTARSLGYENLPRATPGDRPRTGRGRSSGPTASHDPRQVGDATTFSATPSSGSSVRSTRSCGGFRPRTSTRAAQLLAKASRLWWSAIGPSAFLAGYAAFLCRRFGTPPDTLTHAGPTTRTSSLPSGERDAVVVLAYGRIHAHVPSPPRPRRRGRRAGRARHRDRHADAPGTGDGAAECRPGRTGSVRHPRPHHRPHRSARFGGRGETSAQGDRESRNAQRAAPRIGREADRRRSVGARGETPGTS